MELLELNPETSFSEIEHFINLLYSELFGEESLLSRENLNSIRDGWISGGAFHKAYKVIEGGEEIGFFTLSSSFSFFAHGHYGIINELWVSPEHRSKGYGGLILSRIIDLAKRFKWERVDVSAPPFPQWDKTFEFYQKYGFQFTGRKLKYIIKQP